MLKKISDFGITMKEAEDKTKELARAAEGKAEPQDESETICYYYTGEEPHGCAGPMGGERHYVIIAGKMVMAHKRCHKLATEGTKVTPNVMIR